MTDWLMSAFDHVVIPEQRGNAELQAKLEEYETSIRAKLRCWSYEFKHSIVKWVAMLDGDCMQLHVLDTNLDKYKCYLLTKTNGFTPNRSYEFAPCDHPPRDGGSYPDHPYFFILLKLCRERAVELGLREPEPEPVVIGTPVARPFSLHELASKPIPDDVFHRTAKTVADVIAEKNVKYGDSFSTAPAILELLYPDGIQPKQYADVLTIVRMLDKIKRIATDKDPNGENPYADIAGYAILQLATRTRDKD